jgi:hypothetical protein
VKNRDVYALVRGRAPAAAAVIGATLLVGCGGGDSASSDAKPTAEPAAIGFVALETERCPTSLAKKAPPAPLTAKTRVVIPRSVATDLAVYVDDAGTTLIGPKGWECEAGIGSDRSERINVFPPSHEDPGEPPFRPGEVVSLQLYPTCERCIAEYVCALFPSARPVTEYRTAGTTRCPPEGLPEQVARISPTMVAFFDGPNAKGTGTGSGGETPSRGAMSFTEASGMRKVSCTLPSDQADVCAGIIAATMLSAPL